MPRILLSPDAKADLSTISSYVEAEAPSPGTLSYPAAADRVLEDIDRVFRSLASHPLMGRVSSVSPDLRVFSAKRYLIFYRPLKNGIEVARVLHTARDIRPDYFFEKSPPS